MPDFLAVDTSSKYLTVLAVKGQRTILHHLEECAMRHSVILMDEIDRTLGEAGLSPDKCDFFAAVTGPGSFTGIRIGLSTIKGFCLAMQKPGLGVTSFDLIAYNVAENAPFGVAIDAMHGNYYFAAYNADGAQFISPCYLSGGQVESYGLSLYGFEDLPLKNYKKLNAGDCLQRAVLTALANGGSGLHALYVRKSQAEEARVDHS